jgi:hypothetical protein
LSGSLNILKEILAIIPSSFVVIQNKVKNLLISWKFY